MTLTFKKNKLKAIIEARTAANIDAQTYENVLGEPVTAEEYIRDYMCFLESNLARNNIELTIDEIKREEAIVRKSTRAALLKAKEVSDEFWGNISVEEAKSVVFERVEREEE